MKKRYYFHIHIKGRDELIGGVSVVSKDEKTAYKEAEEYARNDVSVDLVAEDDEE